MTVIRFCLKYFCLSLVGLISFLVTRLFLLPVSSPLVIFAQTDAGCRFSSFVVVRTCLLCYYYLVFHLPVMHWSTDGLLTLSLQQYWLQHQAKLTYTHFF